jgi:hypothetical protein
MALAATGHDGGAERTDAHALSAIETMRSLMKTNMNEWVNDHVLGNTMCV